MKRLISLVVSTLFIMTGCNDMGEEKHMKLQSSNLIHAAEKNDREKVQEILQDATYLINETNEKGESPLLIATHGNLVEVAKLLIDAGADINQQDHIQDSAYLYAGAQGKTEILKYMIEHSSPNQNIVNRYGGNTLIPAAEKGHLDNVKLLLRDGKVNIDHQNNFGYTALIEAVALTDGSEVYQQIVQELLAYNANKELRDHSGRTALDYAKKHGYTKMIEMLEQNNN